jgi:hypothetical protein
MTLLQVPYLVKASDLKEIAPLWKQYTIMIQKRLTSDPDFKRKHAGIGLDWAMEMFAYNFASTTLGIKTDVLTELQIRDIESVREYMSAPTIHTGRAWFPKEHATMAEKWRSEDDGGFFKGRRVQVWCKCNTTAADIQPWPLPEHLDFVSYHTLRIMHDSVQRFGPVPVNESFRWPKNYHRSKL